MIDSWRKNEKNKSLSDLSALDVVRCYHSESYNRTFPFVKKSAPQKKVARFCVLKKEFCIRKLCLITTEANGKQKEKRY